MWRLDLLGIKPNEESTSTHEDLEAQRLQDLITKYDPESKTWSTGLLFKQRPPNLGPNKRRAIAILKKFEASTIAAQNVEVVNAAYDQLVSQGFAEEVFETDEPSDVHYLPAQAVFRSSSTTACRIVHNASSISETGKSLNHNLYRGCNLLPNVVQIMLRFRIKPVAYCLDISKMFLRIKLHQDRDFLRYLWRECNTAAAIRIFRMTSVTFSVISSPFQAIDVVLKTAEMLRDKFPLAAQLVKRMLYMDDILACYDDVASATDAVKQCQQLFHEANMTPHKFAGTHPETLSSVPDISKAADGHTKVLGLQWDTQGDVLSIVVPDILKTTDAATSAGTSAAASAIASTAKSTTNDTKRSFLEVSAKIFDPMGWTNPATLKVKLLFQSVWLHEHDNETVNQADRKAKKASWDRPLPPHIQAEWDSLKLELAKLDTVQIPRCIGHQVKMKDNTCRIFAFGDASKKAYATAVYLVWSNDIGETASHLVFSKTRVAPLQKGKDATLSIVRLELLAALICFRSAQYVKDAIEPEIVVTEMCYFTDSLINLHRIRAGPDRFTLWTSNRLAEILAGSTSQQWHHCPGEINPADLPTRGLTADELKASDLWWHGPPFVKKPKAEWPSTSELAPMTDPEERKQSHVTNAPEQMIPIAKPNWDFIKQIVTRFEDWHKTLRLVHFILVFASKSHRTKFRNTGVTLESCRATKKALWRMSQQHHFTADFTCLANNKPLPAKSLLLRYNPYLDAQDGIIRSNTRLVHSDLPNEQRLPIVMPKGCDIFKKFILHLHKSHYHAKAGYLHGLLRQEFLLQRGRQQIQSAIWPCAKRHCHMPRDLGQQMAPLPSSRIDNPAPFQHVAVDLFGPMRVFHTCGLQNCPHPEDSKVYGAVFTCFHARAVHIELVDSQSTESFLTAFRSFVARRGTPNLVYSDNGTNLVAAQKEIRRLYKSINWAAIKQDGLKREIKWEFCTQQAPWQNGLVERLNRSIKQPLRAAVGSAKLTKAQLAVILHEIEQVVNGRTLGVTTDEPSEWVPISPAELVAGRRLEQLPDPKVPLQNTNFGHLWKRRQAILNQFWKRWSASYLQDQAVRKKWFNPSATDLIGRVVLIKDDKLSRNEWLVGRIIEAIPSKDGLIRNVVVKTPTSKLHRAVQKLALFEQI